MVDPIYTYVGGIAFLVLIIGSMLYLTFSTMDIEEGDEYPSESVVGGVEQDEEEYVPENQDPEATAEADDTEAIESGSDDAEPAESADAADADAEEEEAEVTADDEADGDEPDESDDENSA